jgi:hypothetical protein
MPIPPPPSTEHVRRQIKQRFRLALVGYLVMVVGTVVALFVAYHEIHNINRNTAALAVFGICDMPPAIQREVFADTSLCPVLLEHQFQIFYPIFANQR